MKALAASKACGGEHWSASRCQPPHRISHSASNPIHPHLHERQPAGAESKEEAGWLTVNRQKLLRSSLALTTQASTGVRLTAPR